jgi:monoamine oxidase
MRHLQHPPPSRRQFLARIGQLAGDAALLRALTALGFMAGSAQAATPLALQGAPRGASVLVLGAGIAGLVAAYELRRAGYAVQVLEYNQRAGGRAWTLRGGDTYTELGGANQRVEFDAGHYLNPGPWRIPYHHHGVLGYAHRLGVALEPFVQVNHNAWLHSKNAYGGQPRRFREVQADFNGQVAELLGKALQQHRLDEALSSEDLERLRGALQQWGALDRQFRYVAGEATSERRGWAVEPGGGLMPAPQPSQPLALGELLKSGLWRRLAVGQQHEFQTTLFQPVGGMDRIAMALYEQVKELVQFGARVTALRQDERGVSVTYTEVGAARQARADWCVCTLPLSVLSRLEVQVGAPMQEAIAAVPYEASVKVGLQFKRRFWEEDEQIYGGISFTDLPIATIGYPNHGYGQPGKGVLLGAYIWGPNAYEFTAMTPQQRVQWALQYGAQIHRQYPAEFDTGVAVAWHRVPGAHGCFGAWSDEARAKHYANLCAIDGRVVLAGEHASLLPAWQEGAVLSAHDAIQRLHARAVAKG